MPGKSGVSFSEIRRLIHFSMLHEFSRTELIIGKEALDKLKQSKVAIFGIGGVGSFAAEALARSGTGKLVLVDDDCVCMTNINRQIHALHSTIGRPKVDVMKERIMDINPEAEVTAYRCFYLPGSAEELIKPDYDYIIDAVDTVTAKIDLVVEACKASIPIISCMGTGNKLDPARFEVADIFSTSVCPLARVMRKELRQRGIKGLKVVYSRETPVSPGSIYAGDAQEGCAGGCICPEGSTRRCVLRNQIPGSISFLPSVAGLIIAGEVIKDLILY